MFNWLKKKKEVKEYTLKFTPLYLYIMGLFNDISTHKCSILSSNKVEKFVVTKCLDISKTIEMQFKSKQGLINFEIERTKDCFVVTYINTETRWAFEITCSNDYTGIDPDLGVEIKARDVQLALIEISEFIRGLVLEEIDKVMRSEYNHEVCLKELKKLENWN